MSFMITFLMVSRLNPSILKSFSPRMTSLSPSLRRAVINRLTNIFTISVAVLLIFGEKDPSFFYILTVLYTRLYSISNCPCLKFSSNPIRSPNRCLNPSASNVRLIYTANASSLKFKPSLNSVLLIRALASTSGNIFRKK